MYKDIISYSLASGTTHEHFITVAKKVWTERMSTQEGCLSREINTNKDGGYTDIVCRSDKAAADKANEAMASAPAEWFACYDMSSIKTINVKGVASFPSN